MNYIQANNRKNIGFKGESAVIDKLKTMGFELHRKNIKSLDAEIDVVVYKYDSRRYTLDIRIIEVKTRGSYEFDLESLGIGKKWSHISRHIFNIKAEIDSKFDVLSYSAVHFDLALVKYTNGVYTVYSYIKDVNLLL